MLAVEAFALSQWHDELETGLQTMVLPCYLILDERPTLSPCRFQSQKCTWVRSGSIPTTDGASMLAHGIRKLILWHV